MTCLISEPCGSTDEACQTDVENRKLPLSSLSRREDLLCLRLLWAKTLDLDPCYNDATKLGVVLSVL